MRFKICQIVAGIIVISQFHEFFQFDFWRVFAMWPNCGAHCTKVDSLKFSCILPWNETLLFILCCSKSPKGRRDCLRLQDTHCSKMFVFVKSHNICFDYPIFRFRFLVIFGYEVTKIQKYYMIFVYILQAKMGKMEKITQLKRPKYQKMKLWKWHKPNVNLKSHSNFSDEKRLSPILSE